MARLLRAGVFSFVVSAGICCILWILAKGVWTFGHAFGWTGVVGFLFFIFFIVVWVFTYTDAEQ